MPISNEAIKSHEFLTDMYSDDYYPDFLVDKIKAILMELCEQIEASKPGNEEQLLVLTHAATEKTNELEDEFDENESELETVAREAMGADFEFIVKAYGFEDVDIEDVIAPREW